MITLRIPVPVPDFLWRPVISLLLFYRRIRYGYGFRLIRLTKGKFAIVDGDDYYGLAKHTWFAVSNDNKWYAIRPEQPEKDGRLQGVRMHRELMGSPKGMYVDHINGNGLDNRRANIRIATKQQNCWNRKKRRGNCSSRFKGVSLNKKTGKWTASIFCDGQSFYIGLFSDEEAAARAYDAKARELYGEYAWQNFS